ncbi:class I tRNA ligase family protein, partial [Candidatus Auribacterota bacterium]
MKAALKDKEPEALKLWEEKNIYKLLRDKNKGKDKFILHDGPPYANGDIHIGHALNKTLKDFIVKYKSMRGFDAPYVPGWDCHGLPVEHALFKELKKSKHEVDHIDFRKKAREYAGKYVDIQKEQFKRLGIFGEWEDPYLTMNPVYTAGILHSFTDLYKKGYVYRGMRPIHWCMRCETALAEAEIEYEEHTSPSIFVKFEFVDSLDDVFPGIGKVSILIWTTTPWTLPANMATAVKGDLNYVAVEFEKDDKKEKVVLLSDLVDKFFETIEIKEFKRLGTVKGEKLKGKKYSHPFMDRINPVILCDFVETTE